MKNRRGFQIAVVATARKMLVLAWHLVTKDQDYAFAGQAWSRSNDASLNWPPVRPKPTPTVALAMTTTTSSSADMSAI